MRKSWIVWSAVGMVIFCSIPAWAQPWMSQPIPSDGWGPFVVYKNLAETRVGSTPWAYGDWEIGLRKKGDTSEEDPFKPKAEYNNYIWPNSNDPNTWPASDPNNLFTLTFTKATGRVELTLGDAPTLSYDYKEYAGRGMDKLYLMARADTRKSDDPNDTYTCSITQLQVDANSIANVHDLVASCSDQSVIHTYATLSGLDCNDFTLTGNIVFSWSATTAPKGPRIEALFAFGKAGPGPDIIVDGIISPGEWYGKRLTTLWPPDPNAHGAHLAVYAYADPNFLHLAYNFNDDVTDVRNDPNHNFIDQLSVYIGLLGRVGAYRYRFDSVVNDNPNHQFVEIIDGYKCWWTEADDSQIGDPIWGPIGTDAPMPDGIEYVTTFNSDHRVSEICIPAAALADANGWDIQPGDTLRIGGTLTNDYDPNSFVYPEGLDWPDPNTYLTFEISPFPSTDTWSLLDRASVVHQGPEYNPWVIKLESISAEVPPWGSVAFLPPGKMTFNQLAVLSADYNMTTGSFGGGSPRFSLLIDWNDSGIADTGDRYAFVYWGTPPDYNDTPAEGWHNTGNLYNTTDLRVDLYQFGGAFYSTIDDAKALFGNKTVCEVILLLDGSWIYDQVLLVDNITVGNYVYDAVPLGGGKIRGDLNGDSIVDIDDLLIMVRNWLRDDCLSASCEGADLAPPQHDGAVNFLDYAVLVNCLLVSPQNQADTTAPEPDPAMWASVPQATGPYSITMTAATATDENAVEYYFQNITNPTHSSNWQDSSTYLDTGLESETEYTYKVKTRDKSPNHNETAYSATASATTRNADVNVEVEGIFTSVASQDGRVWNGGDSPRYNDSDQDNKALRLGDYYNTTVGSVGYRTILSFDTSSLPENCTITSVRLEMTRGASEGEDPFTWGGSCNVDIINPYFGTSADLEDADWLAAAGATAVASFAADPGPDQPMLSTGFNAQGLTNINLYGTTQLRVYFSTPTYNETNSDYLGFYSGEKPAPEQPEPDLRPKLIIRYTTPTRAPTVTFSGAADHDGRVWNGGDSPRYNDSDQDNKALRLGDYYNTTVGSVGYRTILSFDTSSLPDDRPVTSASLQLTRGAEEGDNPFSWGGSCNIDVISPYFGTSVSLEDEDWLAAAGAAAVAFFSADPGLDQPMLSTEFNAQGLANINKTGTTQLRVYFTTPTYYETTSDYLGFYSGEYGIESYRPKFIIQYSID